MHPTSSLKSCCTPCTHFPVWCFVFFFFLPAFRSKTRCACPSEADKELYDPPHNRPAVAALYTIPLFLFPAFPLLPYKLGRVIPHSVVSSGTMDLAFWRAPAAIELVPLEIDS